MEIIKPACKAVRISKAIYLPQCSAQPRLTQPSYQRNPVLWAEPIKLKRRVRYIVCTRPDTHADLSCGILLHSTVSHDFSSSETWTSVKMTLGHHHHPCTWPKQLTNESSRSSHMQHVWLHFISFDLSTAIVNNALFGYYQHHSKYALYDVCSALVKVFLCSV